MRLRRAFSVSAVSVLVFAALSWSATSQADTTGQSATIDPTITCTNGTGSIDITLTAGSAATTFAVWGSHEFLDRGDDVAAHQTITISVFLPNIADEVTVGIPASDEDDDLADATVVAATTVRARCDEVPYTNVGGGYSACNGHVDVYEQNTSTAYSDDGYGDPPDPADVSGPDALKPVTFTIRAESPDGSQTILDTFVLDLGTQSYQRDFGPDELGDATRVVVATTGTPDDATPDVIDVDPEGCATGGTNEVLAPPSSALPDTGY